MPRRKSTQSSPLKRPSDEELACETVASKQAKISDSADGHSGSPVQETGQHRSVPGAGQDGGSKTATAQPKKVKVKADLSSAPSSAGAPENVEGVRPVSGTAASATGPGGFYGREEMVVVTRTLPVTLPMAKTEVSQSGAASAGVGGSKPNRSLEALFQVTDSELQNMRQEPQTPASVPATVTKPKPLPPSNNIPAIINTTSTASASSTTHNIVVLSNVGPSIISQDGVRLIITEDVSSASAPVKPLHHHKAAILQHNHQQQQQLQQQQLQLQPPATRAVLMTPNVTLAAATQPVSKEASDEASPVEKKHPALGSMLHKQKMKLVYMKQAFDFSSDSSVVSVSAPTSSTVSVDSGEEAGLSTPQSSVDSNSGSTLMLSALGLAGRKRKHPQKPGRHVCYYCGRGCAKPSVLQKHLRAHTGERPYPCHPCGFSFKTKSNLYKHQKSLAHAVKVGQIAKGQLVVSTEEVVEKFGLEGEVLTKEGSTIEEESGGDSERTHSDAEASMDNEDDVVVVREDTGTKDTVVMRLVSCAGKVRSVSPSQLCKQVAVSQASGSSSSDFSASGKNSLSQAQESATKEYTYDKPVREESILENIRQKIDKKKLLEWSRQMDRLKHKEHVDLLQVHSNFPTRIAPKAGSADTAAPAQLQSHAGFDSLSSDAVLGFPDSSHPSGTLRCDSEPATSSVSHHSEAQFSRQASAPATLTSTSSGSSLPVPPLRFLSQQQSEGTKEEKEVREELGSVSGLNQATKALQKLEALKEKFPDTAGCTYTFKTLPDNAIQVTIHMAKDKKEETAKEKGDEASKTVPAIQIHGDKSVLKEPVFTKSASIAGSAESAASVAGSNNVEASSSPQQIRLAPRMPPLLSRSISADCKLMTSEILKDRIQKLISANAAIVDMPMVEPPRSKGRFSRQNSDSCFQSWKINDQLIKTVGSEDQVQSASAVSSSSSTCPRIAIPTISSVPLHPIPADGEIEGRPLLSSSASLDVSQDRSVSVSRDLRRSVSVSNVRVNDQSCVFKPSEVKNSAKEMDKVYLITSPPSLVVANAERPSELAFVSSDGKLSIPSSLPAEVLNALSSASAVSGNAAGEIKIQFKLGKSTSEQTFSLAQTVPASTAVTEKVSVPMVSIPMIGQPGMKLCSAGGETNLSASKQASHHAVIKDLLQKGTVTKSTSSLMPPCTVPDTLFTRHPKLKLDAKVKSADGALNSTLRHPTHITKPGYGPQQVVLTVKDVHSKSMDASSTPDASDQTRVFTVRDAILGVTSISQPCGSLSSEGQQPGSSLLGDALKDKADSLEKYSCKYCGVLFEKSQYLNMHMMFYCTKSKQITVDPSVIEAANAKIIPSATAASPSSVSVDRLKLKSGKLQFHHHSEEELNDKLNPSKKTNNPAFLKSHSTTEVEARSSWQKDDYPQLRSQLTLRPSQSVDENCHRGDGAAKQQQNFIIENIDPLVPPKKGRPKGSKNKPRDLNIILAKANVKMAASKALAGLSVTSVPPILQTPPSSASVSTLLSSPITTPATSQGSKVKIAPKLILPRSQFFTPLLTIAQPTAPVPAPSLIGQPMISIHPAETMQTVGVAGVGANRDETVTSGVLITPPSSSIPQLFVSQPEMLSSTTGFPLGIPSMVSTPQGTTVLTPGTPGTPGTPSTPGTPGTPSSDPQALWKLKLKGKLLMRRSISEQRMMSIDAEKPASPATSVTNPTAAGTPPPSSTPQSLLLSSLNKATSSPFTLLTSSVVGVQGANCSAVPSREPLQAAPQMRPGPTGMVVSLGGLKLSKAASTSSTEKSSDSVHGISSFFRTLSEPVTTDTSVIANIPKLELLAGVLGSSQCAALESLRQEVDDSLPGDDGGRTQTAGSNNLEAKTAVTEAVQTEKASSSRSMVGMLKIDEMVATSAPLQPGGMLMSVPVVLAQPVFVNSQIVSGAYRPLVSVNMLAQGQRWTEGISREVTPLAMVVLADSNITLPAVPVSSLLNPGFSRPFAVTTSTKAHSSSSMSRSMGMSCGESLDASGSEKQSFGDGAQENKAVDDQSMSAGSGERQEDGLSSLRQTALAVVNQGQHDDAEKEPTSPARQAAPLTVMPYHLQSHSVPALHTSTCVTYCCVKRAQPMYVQVRGSNRRVSMYSNWRLSKHNPNPVGLTSRMLLTLYRSRYTSNPTYSTCAMLQYSVTHSSYWQYHHGTSCKQDVAVSSLVSLQPTSAISSDSSESASSQDVEILSSGSETAKCPSASLDARPTSAADVAFKDEAGEAIKKQAAPAFQGGYKSEDIYEYIRGRGRGKYVCKTCGIRCKKPSMLKKHLRTHTDFRPYHCRHCKFSFKTKGNLTKHMKSKAHQKRCLELGIFPIPLTVEESQIDEEALAKQCAIAKDAHIVENSSQDLSMSAADGEGDDDENDDEDDMEDDDNEEDEGGQRSLEGEDGDRGRSIDSELSEQDCSATAASTSVDMTTPLQMLERERSTVPVSSSTADRNLASSTYNLDTEIARSLLDLSRKVEAQGIGETATRSLETESALSRLDSLIGALMSRTKPLSGLKLGMDNSPIVVCIKELEGDGVGLIISQEGQAGKEMTTPVIRINSVSDDDPDSQSSSPSWLTTTTTVTTSTTATASTLGDPTLSPRSLAPISAPSLSAPALGSNSSPNTLASRPKHLSLLTPPSPGPVDAALPVAASAAVQTSTTPAAASINARPFLANPPSPSLMKFLPAYMSAHKFPGYTPTSQGPIVGQLIPKAGAANAGASSKDSSGPANNSNSENLGSMSSMLSTPMSGQPFQFNNPFQEIFQRQNSRQQENAASSPVVLVPSSSSPSLPSEQRLSPHRMTSPFSPLLKRSSWFSDSGESPVKGSVSSKESAMRTDQSPSRTELGPSGSMTVGARVQSSPTKSRLAFSGSSRDSPSPQQAGCVVSKDVSAKQVSSSSQKPGLSLFCDVCQVTFSGQQQMVHHRATHFEKEKVQQQFKCNVCHKTFQLEALLKRHQMAESHLVSAMLKPPMLSTQRSEEVRDREEDRILDKEPAPPTHLSCTFCKVLFQDQGELNSHLRSKKHVNALEQLGMLPIGTYEKLRQDYEERDFSFTENSENSSQPAADSLSFEEQNTRSVTSTSQSECIKSSETAACLPSSFSVCSPENLSPLRINAASMESMRMSQSVVDARTTHSVFSEHKRSVSGESTTCVEHVLKAKKPKLQLIALNSIDSDPDGDCHLVIDESQIEASGKKSPDSVAEADGAIRFQKSLKSSTTYLARSTVVTGRRNSEKLEETSPGFEAVDAEVKQEAEEHGLKVNNPNSEQVRRSPLSVVVEEEPSSALDVKGAVCGLCGDSFPTVAEMKAHMLSHPELRPHVCEYCDAGFTNAQSLRTHLHTHRQERPYICGMCGDTFALSDDLHVHTASHSNTSIMRPAFDHPGPPSPISQSAIGSSSPLHLLRVPSNSRVPSVTRSSSTQSLAAVTSAGVSSASGGGGHLKRARSPEGELLALSGHQHKRLAMSHIPGGYVALAKSKSLTELQGQDALPGEVGLDGEKLAERSSSLSVPVVFQRARSLEGATMAVPLTGGMLQRRDIPAIELVCGTERTGKVSTDRMDSGAVLRAALPFSQANLSIVRPASPLVRDGGNICVQVNPGVAAAEVVLAKEAGSQSPYQEKVQVSALSLDCPQPLKDVTQSYRSQVDTGEHRPAITDRMSVDAIQNLSRQNSAGRAASSSANESSADRRQQSCEKKAADRSGHERRPTICRQEEIEIGDQDLAAVDSIVDGAGSDSGDGIFEDGPSSCDVQKNLTTVPLVLGNSTGSELTATVVTKSKLAEVPVKASSAPSKVTRSQGADLWQAKNTLIKSSLSSETRLPLATQGSSLLEKSLLPYQAAAVSLTTSIYSSTTLVAPPAAGAASTSGLGGSSQQQEFMSGLAGSSQQQEFTSGLAGSSQQQEFMFARYQNEPPGVGVEYERSLGSMYHSLQSSRMSGSSGRSRLDDAPDVDYHQSSPHHEAVAATDYKLDHHHSQADHILAMRLQEEEEMDSEVQSYFSNHLRGSGSQDITSAILMNDGDSDDPQLLVCEEEMGDSGKDNASDDMDDSAMVDGGEQNLGSKSGDWDDWTLSVDMQPSESEADLLTSQ